MSESNTNNNYANYTDFINNKENKDISVDKQNINYKNINNPIKDFIGFNYYNNKIKYNQDFDFIKIFNKKSKKLFICERTLNENTRDTSVNLNSTSLNEETSIKNYNRIKSNQNENECISFLIDISNKPNSNIEKNSNDFIENENEKVEPILKNEEINFLDLKNDEADTKSDINSYSNNNLNIYLPYTDESMEIDFDSKSTLQINMENFSRVVSHEKFEENSINSPIETELKDFPLRLKKQKISKENLIINNGQDESVSRIIGNLKSQELPEESKALLKVKRHRKKGGDYIDELMQDSFLKCFQQSFKKANKDQNDIFASSENVKKKNRNLKKPELVIEDKSDNILKNEGNSENETNADNEENVLLSSNFEKVNKITNFIHKGMVQFLKQDDDIKLSMNEENSISKIKNRIYKNSNVYLRRQIDKLIRNSELHKFMFKNFPEEYSKELFYSHFKKNQHRRKNLKDEIFLSKNELKSYFLCDYMNDLSVKENCDSDFKSEGCKTPKLVWDPKGIEKEKLDNYLFTSERKWPMDIYEFSEDIALDFLKYLNFDINKAIKFIQYTNRVFKSFIKDKDLKIKKTKRSKVSKQLLFE